MTPLAAMHEAVGSMERVRALLMAREPLTLWVCCACGALTPRPVCSPECEAEMMKYEGRQP